MTDIRLLKQTPNNNTKGIIVNTVTGTTLIGKDINSTYYEIADQMRKLGERQNWIYFCHIEETQPEGSPIPTYYLVCP